jgi:hypothetical protein
LLKLQQEATRPASFTPLFSQCSNKNKLGRSITKSNAVSQRSSPGNFWTNVSNWALDADIESVEIDGRFAAGAQGTTNSKSSGRIKWRIVEEQAGRAVIKIPLSGAVGRFSWTFEGTVAGTRITQCYTLEANISAGMRKLCVAMESAPTG